MKNLLGLILLITLPGIVFAQRPLSLEQAKGLAVQNNVNVRNARIEMEKAEQRMAETRAVGLPQINAKVEYTAFPSIPTTLLPAEIVGGPAGTTVPVKFGQPHTMDVGVSASQLVFDGSFFYGLRAASRYVNLSRKQLQEQEYNAKYNAATAYFGALILKENKAIIAKNILNLEKIYSETKALYEEGFVEEIEVDRLALSLNNLRTSEKTVNRQQKNAMANLKFLLDLPATDSLELTDNLEDLLNSVIIVPTAGNVHSNRVEFQILNAQKTLNEINIKVNQSKYLPSLYLFGSYTQNAQRDQFDFFDFDKDWFETAVVGATLNIPIFNGMRTRSTVEQAKLDLERVKIYENNLIRGIGLEVLTAKNELTSAEEAYNNQKESIALAEKIYNVAQIKYKEGVGSSLELTNAEQQLYTTQSNYINSIYNYLIAKTNMQKALGL